MTYHLATIPIHGDRAEQAIRRRCWTRFAAKRGYVMVSYVETNKDGTITFYKKD